MSRPLLPKQSEYAKLDANSEVQQRLPLWPPDQDEITESVVRAIADGHWFRYSNGINALDGSPHQLLRDALVRRFDCRHVRLVSSGTAAVELALRACRVGRDDEVILCAYDYPGNLRCIAALGAKPVMVDLENRRWTMDVQQVAEMITPKTRAIIASHLYQNMSAIEQLRLVADKAGVYLIEDACQSPGSMIELRGTQSLSTDEPVENAESGFNVKPAGTVGHIGTLSFGGTKLLTAGNGGAILTDDDRLSQRLTVTLERPSDTFPLSQLQAATLLPQLENLDHWNAKRQLGAHWFTEQLSKLSNSQSANLAIFLPELLPGDSSAALYKFAFFLSSSESRDQLLARVRSLGIPCGHGFPCFARRVLQSRRSLDSFPNATRAAETTVVLDHRALIADLSLRNEILNEIVASL